MDLSTKKCIPCEVGGTALRPEDILSYTKDLPEWKVATATSMPVGDSKIQRAFAFNDFLEAMTFVNKVAVLAESEGHHPDIQISYNKVVIELSTHAVKGLTENDFILAAKINGLRA